MQITTIGLDLAKHWFQVHGVDADGSRIRRKLRRGEVLNFFQVAARPAWSASRPVRRRIIGRAN